jgi:hypothetical protein
VGEIDGDAVVEEDVSLEIERWHDEQAVRERLSAARRKRLFAATVERRRGASMVEDEGVLRERMGGGSCSWV